MRSRILEALLLGALLGAGVSCNKSTAGNVTAEPIENPHGDLTQLPDPEAQSGSVGRAARRLTVNQLARSIEVAVGRPWTGLESVAASLGRADYAQVNTESTDPNLVFAKFLEDGAREVCIATAVADLAQPTPSSRILSRALPGPIGNLTTVTDAQSRENLIYLSTRFWGAPLSGPELESWVTLFKNLSTRAETARKRDHAFAGLCIALMTDPRFLTY